MEDNSTPNQSVTVMSTALRYGLILSIISIAYSIILIVLGTSVFETDWLAYVSYAFMIGAVVLAHKYFKDNGDGYMTYGQGFGIAFLTTIISLIASAVFSYIYMKLDPAAMDQVWEKMGEKMASQGQSDEAVEKGLEIVKKFFWAFYILGSMFWATIIALIVTIFTQKKRPEVF